MLFRSSASLFLPCKQAHLYHLSRFHTHALKNDVCFSLFDLLSIIGSRFIGCIFCDTSSQVSSLHLLSSRTQIQRRQWQPTPVLWPGKSHGWRSLVGCSPWGCEESDTTERLHFHFSLSCVGEGNGNPLQGSCLENPRDGGVW